MLHSNSTDALQVVKLILVYQLILPVSQIFFHDAEHKQTLCEK